MKESLNNFLSHILGRLSRLTIWRFRPIVVGITGSAGKTSAKLAVAAVLGSDRRIRWARGNLNTELGLILCVLGDWSDGELALVSRATPPGTRRLRKLVFWLRVVLFSSARFLFGRRENYPEILILEYGVDRPGDMKKLLTIARPDVSIVTAMGGVPVHVEYFSGPEEVVREKARLVESLPTQGYAILNQDDEQVIAMRDRTRSQVITFGFSRGADVRISALENRSENGRPLGISFKLHYGGSLIPVRMDGVLGKAHALAAAAGAAAGTVFALNLVRASEALKNYAPAHSRMEIVPGVKDSWLIDDSYNASPLATAAALEAFHDLPAKRHIAVLGDMLEIGRYSEEEHKKIGKLAAGTADVLIAVGPRGKFILEGAKKSRRRGGRTYHFHDAGEAGRALQSILRKGDLVLIKASRGIGLDRVVEEVRMQKLAQ